MRSLLTILCLFASSAHAVPGQFTHQGRILNDDGTPITGEATITFRVINAETGGVILWKETQTITLTNGFYATVLGAEEDENPLDTSVLQQAPVWLELQLAGKGAMYPRNPIHAVPYATISTVLIFITSFVEDSACMHWSSVHVSTPTPRRRSSCRKRPGSYHLKKRPPL